jgi:hypothetical protein
LEAPGQQVAWIDAEQSPYKVRVLDCRSVCGRMLSSTKDPAIVARFVQLRASRGEEYRGQVPTNCLHAPCDLRYRSEGKILDGPFFKAKTMEDKWDIYVYDGSVYFVRSWRGELSFRAKWETLPGEVVISSIDADSVPINADMALAIRQVDFLVKSHILRREVPHPLPADFTQDLQAIVIYSFANFGRSASFATYADTTLLPL